MRMEWLVLLALLSPAANAQVAQISGPAVTVTNLPSSTVAGLPSCTAGINGQVRVVTNALTPALGIAVIGGGAVNVIVRCSSGVGWLAG